MPSMTGSRASMMTMSGECRSTHMIASRPSSASATIR